MTSETDLQSKIISELESKSKTKSSSKSSSTAAIDVKKLRKIILLQLQTDTDDNSAKKQYKKAIKALESKGVLSLDTSGLITFLGKSASTGGKSDETKKTKDKKDKKKKKKKKRSHEDSSNGDNDDEAHKKQKVDDENEEDEDDNDDDGNKKDVGDDSPTGEASASGEEKKDSSKKNKPCKGNPLGVTRLFIGNLPFAVDETSLQEFASPAVITHIKWITDKETGKFYGSSFVEIEDSKGAALVVKDRNGEKLMGRPLKINFAPAREGDIWPPKKKEVTGNGGVNGGQAGGSGVKAMSAKPDDCVKLFIGNLSFDIDDDTIVKFFSNVDAEVKAVRWLHHKDSGDFKGCGYVEFWNTEACEKAAALNGKSLMNRPIRIDWTD